MGRGTRVRPKKLPGKLLQIRKRLDMGQAEMARILQRVDPGVYPGMISRFEHGEREPSLIALLEYARLAGVSTDILIDDKRKLPL
jgi:transcriptional regulator with XRE-family HTH domain